MKSLTFLLCLPLLLVAAAEPQSSSSSSCRTRCGNISVPYPVDIGTDPNCSRPGFNLICNQSSSASSAGPKLFLGDGSFEVTDISLTEGRVWINSNVISLYCSGEGSPVAKNKNLSWTVDQQPLPGPYMYSSTRNTVITLGCGVLSYVGSTLTNGTYPFTASMGLCASVCQDASAIKDGACSGIGCCQIDIVFEGTHALSVTLVQIADLARESSVGSCTKAFVVDREWFRFERKQLLPGYHGADSKVPVVLDWAVPQSLIVNRFCEYAAQNLSTFACRSDNSYCYEVRIDFTFGYRCNCSRGFGGNPYISDGCKVSGIFCRLSTWVWISSLVG